MTTRRRPHPRVADLTLEAQRWLAALLVELPPARAARVVAAMTGAARDDVYARALALKAKA